MADVFLYADGTDPILRDPTVPAGTPGAVGFYGFNDWTGLPAGSSDSGFPAQYAGLRAFFGGAVHELCLVAAADAPAGMGGVLLLHKGSAHYGIYLVETSDPNASPIRIRTTTGTKAIRLRT